MPRIHTSLIPTLLLLAACGDTPADAPTAATPAPTAAPSAAPTAPPASHDAAPDPAEAGISDVARISRVIFGAMNDPASGCAVANPYAVALAYTVDVTVSGGRIVNMKPSRMALDKGGGDHVLAPEAWPPTVVSYVQCLSLPVAAMAIQPPPADGMVQTMFGLPPTAGGQALPAG